MKSLEEIRLANGIKVETYHGVDVYLSGTRFEATIGEGDEVQTLTDDTVIKLRTAIDKAKTAGGRRLDLAVMHWSAPKGAVKISEARITGINRATGQFTGLGAGYPPDVYVSSPFVRGKLEELIEVDRRQKALTKELDPFKLKAPGERNSNYAGRVKDSDDYEYRIGMVEARYTTAVAKLPTPEAAG